ncbi:MAG: 16S rRNA (cytosine(967)-C(5))-methyltransferase [Synechococcaceae cyanobacterium]|nr:16S rRNA (cytosine(967)-C(5))-methyltransferase [Synechococcaceae cyanobacterium]
MTTKGPETPAGLAPRALAWRVLLAVAAGAFADVAMERELTRQRLAASDRRLSVELAYGAIRQRLLLDAWIDVCGRVPALRQPPRFRWLLHVGLYQLLFSERIPAAVAVTTTVELAKREGMGRLAPVANGLLRAVLRRRQAIAPAPAASLRPWDGLDLPADPVQAFSLRHSLPPWLAAELLRWLPVATAPGRAEAFARACNAPPPLDLRVNPLRAGRDAVLRAFEAIGQQAVPLAGTEQGITLPGRPGDPRALPGYGEGHWCVQDRHAQAIAPLLDPPAGSMVLDACAAPGGKATHLAELMGDRGEVWAVDRSPGRLRRVEANARRLGLAAVRPLAADATRLAELRPEWQGRFDRILLDAPCSGLGTLSRHADARWRVDPDRIEELVTLQRRLLEAMVPLLAPGGRLLYATCTVHPRENGLLVAAFLRERRDLRLLEQRQWWPGLDERGEAEAGGDGFFAALMAFDPPGSRR